MGTAPGGLSVDLMERSGAAATAGLAGELVVRRPRPSTTKVLEISGLDRVFTVACAAA